MRSTPARVLLAATALVAASGCTSASSPADVAAEAEVSLVVDVPVSEVARLVVQAGDDRVELERQANRWVVEGGGPELASALLREGERGLLPLVAFRTLRTDQPVDGSGLSEPRARLTVVDRRGEEHEVAIGGPTFNDAGFYAQRDGDDEIHLVTRAAVATILSVAAGERFQFPDRVGALVDEALRSQQVGGRDGLPRTTPWLVQALAAGVALPPQLDDRASDEPGEERR